MFESVCIVAQMIKDKVDELLSEARTTIFCGVDDHGEGSGRVLGILPIPLSTYSLGTSRIGSKNG